MTIPDDIVTRTPSPFTRLEARALAVLCSALALASAACDPVANPVAAVQSASVGIPRGRRPQVEIISPLNGTRLDDGDERVGVQVEATGLNPEFTYRILVNGIGEGGASAFFAPTVTGVTEWSTTITVDALPADGKATVFPVTVGAMYPYPTWIDDTPRLFRGFQADLLLIDETAIALSAGGLVDRDRVVVYDFRSYGDSPNTPQFTSTTDTVERTLKTRLTVPGFVHLEPELMTLFDAVAPLDVSIPEVVVSDDAVRSGTCARFPSLEAGTKSAINDALVLFKAGVDSARSAAGLVTASRRSNYYLCVNLGAVEIQDLAAGDLLGLAPAVLDGELQFLASFGGAEGVSATITLDAARIEYRALDFVMPPWPLALDAHACASTVDVLGPVFDATYGMRPRPSDRELSRARQLSAAVGVPTVLTPGGICADSFLSAEILAVGAEVQAAVQDSLLEAWNDYAPEHRLVQALEAIATSFDVGPRGPATPVNTTAPHGSIAIRGEDPLALPDEPGTVESGIIWRTGSVIEATTLAAGVQPATFFHMHGTFDEYMGHWVPESVDKTSPAYDMTVGVNMPLLNQALAAAVPTAAFNVNPTFSYGLLGLDCGPAFDVDCEAPAPLTGDTLGSLFPSVASLGDTPLKVEMRPTLSPVVTMENNAILDIIDEGLSPDPTHLYLHIPQYTVTVREADLDEAVVVEFTVDLFDRDFDLALDATDGRLSSETHLGECDVVPVSWRDVVPTGEEVTLVRDLMVQDLLLPAIEGALHDIAIPELANVPGFAGPLYPLRDFGHHRTNDTVTFFIGFE